MSKKKNILVVILVVLLILLVRFSFFVLAFSASIHEGIVTWIKLQSPVLNYQKTALPLPQSLCQNIQNQEFQRICLAKIENPNLEIEWSLLWDHEAPASGPSPNGRVFHYDSQIYFKALSTNPHYCLKIYNSFLSDWLFGRGPGVKECYQDIAVAWQDSSLCEKATDKDYCYLRLAVKLVGQIPDK